MYSKRWFGFAEVDIEVPQDLCEKFEEFPPIFINQSVGEEGIPQHIKDYLAKSGRVATPNQKKLLGVLKAKKVLLYAPLLEWYYEHGLRITAVYRTIDYVPRKIFDWLVQEVANMRRRGDVEAKRSEEGETLKLFSPLQLSSLKSSSFWATVPTASLSKPLSVRQKCYTRKTKTRLTSICAQPISKIKEANNVTLISWVCDIYCII